MKKKTMAVVCSAILAMGALAGCSSSNTETTAATTAAATEATTAATSEEATEAETSEEAAEAPADLSGSVSMVGSTSMEKFANALAEVFMQKYPDVTVQAEFVGSGAGVEAAASGTAPRISATNI